MRGCHALVLRTASVHACPTGAWVDDCTLANAAVVRALLERYPGQASDEAHGCGWVHGCEDSMVVDVWAQGIHVCTRPGGSWGLVAPHPIIHPHLPAYTAWSYHHDMATYPHKHQILCTCLHVATHPCSRAPMHACPMHRCWPLSLATTTRPTHHGPGQALTSRATSHTQPWSRGTTLFVVPVHEPRVRMYRRAPLARMLCLTRCPVCAYAHAPTHRCIHAAAHPCTSRLPRTRAPIHSYHTPTHPYTMHSRRHAPTYARRHRTRTPSYTCTGPTVRSRCKGSATPPASPYLVCS